MHIYIFIKCITNIHYLLTSSLKRKELKEYIDIFYRPSRLVLAGAGGVNHEELVDLAKKLFKNPKDLKFEAEIPSYSKCRFTGTEYLRL